MKGNALIVAGVLLAGCTEARSGQEVILVAAASDLAGAMPELVEAFQAQTGTRVDIALGSSGQIANQVLHGAPIDVVASADRGWIDRLEAAGRLDRGSVALYAYGRLVMYAPHAPAPPAELGGLRDPAIRRIAVANPEHAPYGLAARQALTRVGLWDELQPKLVIAENVRQAHQFAETGSVDVALVSWSLAGSAGAHYVLVPATFHAPLAQTAAAVAGSAQVEQARAFVRFMTGPAAQEILARYNFVLPDAAAAAGIDD